MILVDSDVLIAHLRGLPGATGWLSEARRTTGRLSVSAIAVAEITGGMRSAERSEVQRLLASLSTIPVDDRIARRAGEFMRRYWRSHSGIGIGDYLIAGTADVHQLDLATLNVRHFPMFDDLRTPFTM